MSATCAGPILLRNLYLDIALHRGTPIVSLKVYWLRPIVFARSATSFVRH